MIIPALNIAQQRAKATASMNNTKQLAAAWLTFPADNQDELMNNPGGTPPGVPGNMSYVVSTETTNAAYLVDSGGCQMADYAKSADIYRDPADQRPPGWAVDRVRSYSLNGALAGRGGSGPAIKGTNPGPPARRYYGSGAGSMGSACRRSTDLNTPGPAMIYTWLCEHQDSLSDSAFMLDAGPITTQQRWRDLPASHHPGPSVTISFADGHAEIHKWMEPYKPAPNQSGNSKRATWYPVIFKAFWIDGGTAPWETGPFMITSKDFSWMQDRMPYQIIP